MTHPKVQPPPVASEPITRQACQLVPGDVIVNEQMPMLQGPAEIVFAETYTVDADNTTWTTVLCKDADGFRDCTTFRPHALIVLTRAAS